MSTTVYHPTLPASQVVPDEALNEWLEQGWLEEEPAGLAPDFDVATSSIPDVIAFVGSDRTRAAAALAAESAKADPRPSLVQKLEKLSNPEGA